MAGIPLRPENGVEVRRRMAIMPESPGLYLRLSVAENLECFADLYDAPDPKDRIDGALRAVGGSRQTRKSFGSRRKSLRSRSHQPHGPYRAIRNASYAMARTTGWTVPLLTRGAAGHGRERTARGSVQPRRDRTPATCSRSLWRE